MRTQYAVIRIQAVCIQYIIKIRANNRFIHEGPDKSATTPLCIPMELPEIAHGCSRTSVILGMKEFGWHIDQRIVQYFL